MNEKPQVIIRETPAREVVSRTVRHHQTVGAAPLAIGTIYMPLALPTVGFPMFGFQQQATHETVEAAPHNPLESFHKAELAQHLAQIQADKARVELSATVAAQQRVASRLGAGPVAPTNGDTSAVEKKLNELNSQMKELNDRVTSIERLLLIHDNIIRDKVLNSGTNAGGTVSGSGAAVSVPAAPKLPMIPPLPEK